MHPTRPPEITKASFTLPLGNGYENAYQYGCYPARTTDRQLQCARDSHLPELPLKAATAQLVSLALATSI